MGRLAMVAVVALAALSAALGASVYAATHATTPAATDVVRAERFELVDSEGNVRAVLGLRAQPIHIAQKLRIVDPEGNVVVVPEESITTLDRGAELPSLVLMDDAGRTRIEVTFDWAGEPVIRMMYEDGRRMYVVPPAYGVEMLER
jgi:hypothetical protein